MVKEKLQITVLVQTKNEEVGIGACLSQLTDFDEVIVVDSNSTDRTREIAVEHGAKVFLFTWNGAYPKKKQWQLENLATEHDWVLFMDADESPTPELISELRSAVHEMESGVVDGYDIPLDYVFAGRDLKYGHRVVKRALLNKRRAAFPTMNDLAAPGMGELEGHYQPVVTGETRRLKGAIRHDDKDPVRTWFTRHNGYSDWEAYLRTHASVRADVAVRRSRQGRLFDSVPFKPLVFFAYAFILRAGFRDGRAGLDYALALAFYYWQIELKVREATSQSDGGSQ
ncbi:glycosyltransferase involved in cell wall biosynthesis [Glaciihabitans tibetensis]|uniref:Glycosyltransferase involved in cell wall biosynthesis n=1 Tax=Glaciihabitans tibetensis TaxID=1266600 RepID=A0A2T0V3C9_9MICO|nr:glycosyltransferase family 2 protein [Glaciihabitans tibetensis]PRY64664.1 glycosyltransferase involved in cell wall biosynthesis [Glaciihabitans tibetensis]